MGKRKTSEEMSRAYAGQFPARYQAMVREAHEAGQRAGHRANRISAAERRVKEVAVAFRHGAAGWEELCKVVDALERAKGGGNG